LSSWTSGGKGVVTLPTYPTPRWSLTITVLSLAPLLLEHRVAGQEAAQPGI